MNSFIVNDLSLSGLKLIKRQTRGDNRGFLSRLFCSRELTEAGWNTPIAQINHTFTARSGTVRGMHFQYPPYAEMKIVSCIRGEILDVAVDIRIDSPTYLNWHAEKLSPHNGSALLIPKGFAHGFQTLTDDVEIIYLHSAEYNPAAEGALNAQDPGLGIVWPLAISEISERDLNHSLIKNGFRGVTL